jgi:hypothetical protein
VKYSSASLRPVKQERETDIVYRRSKANLSHLQETIVLLLIFIISGMGRVHYSILKRNQDLEFMVTLHRYRPFAYHRTDRRKYSKVLVFPVLSRLCVVLPYFLDTSPSRCPCSLPTLPQTWCTKSHEVP